MGARRIYIGMRQQARDIYIIGINIGKAERSIYPYRAFSSGTRVGSKAIDLIVVVMRA